MGGLTVFLGLKCPYCEKKMVGPVGAERYPSRDHLIPRCLEKGFGRIRTHSSRRVTIVCCRMCNESKGSLRLGFFLRHSCGILEEEFYRRVRANDLLVEERRRDPNAPSNGEFRSVLRQQKVRRRSEKDKRRERILENRSRKATGS